jgi:hypothetical protein
VTTYICEGANGPMEIDSRTAELLQTSRDQILIETFVLCGVCGGNGCAHCAAPPEPRPSLIRRLLGKAL